MDSSNPTQRFTGQTKVSMKPRALHYPNLNKHPLPCLLDAGVACSINADDPLLFGSGLLGEYDVRRQAFGLTDDQLADCARVSLRASGAPQGTIVKGLDGVEAWLSGDAS